MVKWGRLSQTLMQIWKFYKAISKVVSCAVLNRIDIFDILLSVDGLQGNSTVTFFYKYHQIVIYE